MKKVHGNLQKFAILFFFCVVLLGALSIAFILLGAKNIALADVWNALFRFDENNVSHIIIRDLRIPRVLADIMVGVSLSVAGAVMQGNTKNPMADSGIMGISAGSMFAVMLIMAFLPAATKIEIIGYSCLGAAGATLLIYGVAMMGKRGMTADRMVLSGMAISTLFSSVTSAIVLKMGMTSTMMKYTAGSSASTVWTDIYIAAPFFIAGFAAALAISRALTVMNLGEEVSKGLGANIKLIKFLSTMVVLILSAIAVVIIGPVGYVGLMVPHIVRYFVGTDYRFVLPSCALLGAVLVVFVDLLARLIIPGREFPVGILLTIIGVPFFIFTSRRQKDDAFGA
ncbi:MAG: iron ABC transporter permease [Clostridiales bacterium]|nr:iron ABC transporter permease [Clostridiales bacterium]